MFFKASSRVFPWLTQPGIDGHSTTQTPSSSRSMVTENFIAFTDKELPYAPKGGTGFGVRILLRYLAELAATPPDVPPRAAASHARPRRKPPLAAKRR